MKEKILALLLETDGFISGEEMSRRLNVSRTAIWKNIKKLKEDGYQIESITNKGYRLKGTPDKLVSEEIKFLLNSQLIQEVFVYDTIDSTNTEAKRQASKGAFSTALFIAEEQTAGKGRRGKTWISKKGNSLYMSLLLKPIIQPQNAAKLTLVAGLAVNQSIKNITKLDSYIKWPNDIVVNQKKVCGILTEMNSEIDFVNYVVIGIGINVNNESFDEEIGKVATSLKIEGQAIYSRKKILVEIINNFSRLYEAFERTESLKFIEEEYNKNCINVNRNVKVISRDITIIGNAIGINEEGLLLVESKEGDLIEVNAGEVSVRGLYGYVD
jgi:BirA family biotin operon repressor/biotin-[acetyl-CoA-carboxylase] ligase